MSGPTGGARRPPAPGEPAPSFSLPSGPGSKLSSDRLRGRPAVFAFYPADWSPVCSDQLSLYQAINSEFEQYHAALHGISVDGVWCHQAFAQARGIEFPLLSDFEPKGAVSRAFGVYRSTDGVSERALFVLDAEGSVVWSEVVEPEVNPGADGILAALDGMSVRTGS